MRRREHEIGHRARWAIATATTAVAIALLPATAAWAQAEPAPETTTTTVAPTPPSTTPPVSPEQPVAPDPYRLTRKRATIAEVVRATPLRVGPGDGRVLRTQGTMATWGGGPVKLLVLESQLDARGRRWLHVRLPTRPNDASGWINADSVRISATTWRIVISRSKRRLSLLRSGRTQWTVRAVVGAPRTPTPVGLFAISEPIAQGSRSSLGPWALHLTSHSNVLTSYGGGPGRVAIHGRAGVLLRDPLGSARSHGCIRVSNAALMRLVRHTGAGTPVQIVT